MPRLHDRTAARAARLLPALGMVLQLSCARGRERDVRIGLLALLTSDLAVQSGVPSRQGAEMAIDEINERGGVEIAGKRHRLRLIVKDYEPRADAAASAARELINLDSADVLLGPQLSPHAVAASSVAEDAQVPMISPMASNPAVTRGRHFVFRLAFLDPFQGEMLARYALEDLHATRAAILYDVANPYSRDIAALFRETFEGGGGRVVASETFTTDEKSDFRAPLQRIAKAGPQVLLLPNYSSVDSFQVRQARAVGVKASFLGSDVWDPPGLRHVPEAIGTVFTQQWSPKATLPQAAAFLEQYRVRYGVDARTTAAMTYDAVRIVADALHRAGTTDGLALAKAIGRTNGFSGVTGTITFDGTGDPRRSGLVSRLGATSDTILRSVDPKP
ncbi:MAG: ABC transporter substrate-binding protein [Gemmatimonadetes bacterium]|nr:ABC transporter substrate-binding protein [Gemmatimonadota bacterium]